MPQSYSSPPGRRSLQVTPLLPGQLRYPVTFQQIRKATEPDEYDHVDTKVDDNWTDFCARRAEVIAVGAEEVVSPDGQILFVLTRYNVRVRYDEETRKINATMRIEWTPNGDKEKYLNIQAAYDPDGIKQQIFIVAIEQRDDASE